MKNSVLVFRSLMATALVLPALFACACGGQMVAWPSDNEVVAESTPLVISAVPRDSAVGVELGALVTAVFSTAMDGQTIDEASFKLTQGATPVAGTVTLDDATNTATFHPAAALKADRIYTARISKGARDLEGTALAADYTWSFACGNLWIIEFTATTEAVPAPDYTLSLGELVLLVDANNLVQSATGAAELTPGLVTGQRYVVANVTGLNLYPELDAAFLAGSDEALTGSIPAADFLLAGVDLTNAQVRTLILANSLGGVRAYQAFEISFLPAD